MLRQRHDLHFVRLRAPGRAHPPPARRADDERALAEPDVPDDGAHRGRLVARAARVEQARRDLRRQREARRRRVRGVVCAAALGESVLSGLEDRQGGDAPDVVDDEKVLAVAGVAEPVRLVQAQLERAERHVVHRRSPRQRRVASLGEAREAC